MFDLLHFVREESIFFFSQIHYFLVLVKHTHIIVIED